MKFPLRTLAVLALPLWLLACSTAPVQAPAGADAVLAPNANLVVQGIPPIPSALVQRVQKYTDFRGYSFVDWHPTEPHMLVSHRQAGASVPQLFLLKGPLATPEPLTQDSEPVTRARFQPRSGESLVFERSSGGNEAAQIFRLDMATRQATQITPPDERHSIVAWLRDGRGLVYSSVPLDRTAQGGKRSEVTTTYWLVDPAQPAQRRKLAELPGGGWGDGDVSPDARWLAVDNYLSAAQSELWLLDLGGVAAPRRLLPASGENVVASHFVGSFSADGQALNFFSDRVGEFREAMQLDLASGRISRLSAHIPWDAEGFSATNDGRVLALSFNVDGRDELRLFDGRSLKELPAPAVPPGSVTRLQFHPRLGLLALGLNGAQSPGQLFALDPASGRSTVWTRVGAPAGVDMGSFSTQRIVRWPSFDGRQISGLLSLPPARFTGKRPVLIEIHGGPEGQAKLGFLGRYNYFVQEMGVAIVQPNVRGSSGFGKSFLALDNGMLREDSVNDIGALLDWLRTQPELDASRVMVAGGSYGGYMSLAVSVHYAERIVGAVDDVGISHFVSFLNNTESYRRDLRRVEYGDERDPAMRAFLDRISPLTQAHRITKPLFVVQGKNDPRVPYTEAEQIVAKARANGTPVWYLRAENEGHGFRRKENADFRFYAMVRFMEQMLMAPAR